MSEKGLRNVFLLGTLFFLVVLGVMTVDSLGQVAAARTPEVTDQVVAGKRTWQSKNCGDCHTILGIGGYYAPELTKVVDRRGADWLTRFLKQPAAVIPGTTMPNQFLSEVEVGNLVAFFQWVGKIDTNQWPPQPVMSGGSAQGLSGPLVFQQKGCAGCHRIDGQGAAGPGPDLSHFGSATSAGKPNSPELLAQWLADPAAVKPGTTMPRIPLSQQEIDVLVQYLAGLK